MYAHGLFLPMQRVALHDGSTTLVVPLAADKIRARSVGEAFATLVITILFRWSLEWVRSRVSVVGQRLP